MERWTVSATRYGGGGKTEKLKTERKKTFNNEKAFQEHEMQSQVLLNCFGETVLMFLITISVGMLVIRMNALWRVL